MGGHTPSTFLEGMLSGLGHPVIGLDHFAAVVAVGCLAAAHRAGPALAVGFVLAMMAGVAVHLHGATVPAAELLVALSVIVLGAILLRTPQLPVSAALGLFVLVGLTHGYALGESIYGAERTALCLPTWPCRHPKRGRARRHDDRAERDAAKRRAFDASSDRRGHRRCRTGGVDAADHSGPAGLSISPPARSFCRNSVRSSVT